MRNSQGLCNERDWLYRTEANSSKRGVGGAAFAFLWMIIDEEKVYVMWISNDTSDTDFNHICLCDFIFLRSHRTSPGSWKRAAARSAKNNLLFAAIYFSLSRRHCRNACCYGFHLLPLMDVYACVSTKYTRPGQCVQCPVHSLSFSESQACPDSFSPWTRTHFLFFFSCFFFF